MCSGCSKTDPTIRPFRARTRSSRKFNPTNFEHAATR
jgi:hypothetical protein